MATPESKVKAAVKALLEKEGVWHFSPAANGFGRAGIPDIIACVNGRFFAIECKAGKGRTNALQDREIKRIIDSGGIALVVSDDAHTVELLQRNIALMKAGLND